MQGRRPPALAHREAIMSARIRSPPARAGRPGQQLNMEPETGGLWQRTVFMEAGQDAKALFSYPKHKT